MTKNRFTKMAGGLAMASVLAFTACENSPYPGYEKTESGVYAKFYKHDETGVTAKEGDMIQIAMSYKNSKDSVLFDSKKMNRSGTDFIEFAIAKSTFSGSFENALELMCVGDSASFIISADSVYLSTFKVKELPKYIDKNSNLTFEAKMLKITPKEEVEKEKQKKNEERNAMMELRKNEEPKALGKYLEENKITAKPTASGLYYIEKTKGHGPKPTKGCMVKMNYTGRLLDGTVFDTSDKEVAKKANVFNERRPYDPIEFPVGEGRVIPGWDEGIMLMTAGAKAQFVIPSIIAYGEQGNGQTIPPYSPLMFDVELVSFGPPVKAETQQMPKVK